MLGSPARSEEERPFTNRSVARPRICSMIWLATPVALWRSRARPGKVNPLVVVYASISSEPNTTVTAMTVSSSVTPRSSECARRQTRTSEPGCLLTTYFVIEQARDLLERRTARSVPPVAPPDAAAAEADGWSHSTDGGLSSGPGGLARSTDRPRTVPAGRGSKKAVDRVTSRITLLGDAPDGPRMPTLWSKEVRHDAQEVDGAHAPDGRLLRGGGG